MTRRRSSGFTLAEILAVMAILAILSAVLVPAVLGQLRKGQSAAVADQLKNLRDAIGNYQSNVGRWPTVLTQLTTAPVTGDPDLCGTGMSAANAAAWRGPYLTQNILGNIPVGDVTVQNDIVRSPTNTPPPQGLLQIVVTGVTINTAADLDKQFDGDSVYTTGSILWTSGTQTLTFQFPIRNC